MNLSKDTINTHSLNSIHKPHEQKLSGYGTPGSSGWLFQRMPAEKKEKASHPDYWPRNKAGAV